MANPLYQALKNNKQPPNNFIQFMQQMKGQNPNELINQLLTSGKINQTQLNQVQQMAQQMQDQFTGFKSMFGFK